MTRWTKQIALIRFRPRFGRTSSPSANLELLRARISMVEMQGFRHPGIATSFACSPALLDQCFPDLARVVPHSYSLALAASGPTRGGLHVLSSVRFATSHWVILAHYPPKASAGNRTLNSPIPRARVAVSTTEAQCPRKESNPVPRGKSSVLIRKASKA